MEDIDKAAELPNELLLRIFANLDLQSLITARCVDQRWRALVPFAEMGDARKSMLDFYIDLSVSPTFHKTRDWVKKNLKPFDRKQYISRLLEQYPSLPDDFRLWVLEWPEKAVIGGVWPGLPRRRYSKKSADGVNVIPGVNWLSYPQVSMMTYVDYHNRIVEPIPGIVIWSVPETLTWLIVDERKHMNGKVFQYGMGWYRTLLEGSLDEDKLRHSYDKLTPSWIAYLRQLWSKIEVEEDIGLAMNKLRINEDEATNPIPPEIPDVLDLAGAAWKRRNTPESSSWLEGVRGTHPFDRVA